MRIRILNILRNNPVMRTLPPDNGSLEAVSVNVNKSVFINFDFIISLVNRNSERCFGEGKRETNERGRALIKTSLVIQEALFEVADFTRIKLASST